MNISNGSSRRHAGVLVTGASGYIGGRLIAQLEARGEQVRCLARRPELLAGRFRPDTAVMAGDILDEASLRAAMAGIATAYYLIRTLGSRGPLDQEEEPAAATFVRAAQASGVRRIVYLAGLNSRRGVGQLLRESGIPMVEFRASLVIGAGSLSFELIRALVERLPVLIAPRWVMVAAQPITVADVVAYLVAALELPLVGARVFEIGGSSVTSYRGMISEYARQVGVRRLFLPIPLLTPRLSSLWLGLVTPLFARVGRKLIESITRPSVVGDSAALEVFSIRPQDHREAIRNARADEEAHSIATRWSDAVSTLAPPRRAGWGRTRTGSRIIDSRVVTVAATPEQAFAPIRRIGGSPGWYYANALWQVRGVVDRLLGGVGMKRGRRDAESLRAGDVLDCWRVISYEPPARLTLQSEMRLPGRGWLQFEVDAAGEPHGTRIRQTALFDPAGLAGLLYWYLLYVPHRVIFRGMLGRIARRALLEAPVSTPFAD